MRRVSIGAHLYHIESLVYLLATPLPERSFTRTATIAQRFLDDGRPPPHLY